jgi:hypothetical protein
MKDRIVEEVRAAGQAYIDSFNGNRKAMLADLRRREKKSRAAGIKVLSLPPKAPAQSTPRKKAG